MQPLRSINGIEGAFDLLRGSLQESRIYAVAKSGMRVSEADPGSRSPGQGGSYKVLTRNSGNGTISVSVVVLCGEPSADAKQL